MILHGCKASLALGVGCRRACIAQAGSWPQVYARGAVLTVNSSHQPVAGIAFHSLADVIHAQRQTHGVCPATRAAAACCAVLWAGLSTCKLCLWGDKWLLPHTCPVARFLLAPLSPQPVFKVDLMS